MNLKISGVLGIWLCATACTTPPEASVAERFQVMKPILADTTYYTEYVGEINAFQNVEIRSRIDGFIESIQVDEGDRVREGQVLFRLNQTLQQQELQSTVAVQRGIEAELKSAQIELENTRSLFEKQIVSDTEVALAGAKVESLEARLAEAEAALHLAEINLSFTQVRSPFNGIINRIPHKKGSLVEQGSLLTSISNNQEMFVYFNVSERQYLDFVMTASESNNTEVSLMLANDQLYPFPGKIETVEGEINRSTGNIAFRARFPNPDYLLKHGGSGKVLLKNSLQNVLLLPHKSTVDIQGNLYVYTVDADTVVHATRFVPAVRLQHHYVVASGITGDDWFVYEGIQRVREGDRIAIDELQAERLVSLN